MNNASKNSKVSVIIVVHEKYLPYLETAINSLRTNKHHEIVLIANECYTKGAVMAQGNLAYCANLGARLSKGKYLMRLDADDFIDSSMIDTLTDYLDTHPDVHAVWCDYMLANEVPRETFTTFYLQPYPQDTLEHPCGVMIRKSVFNALGGYDETLDYQEGYDFWCRFKQAGYIAERLPQPLYFYRRGHQSMSTNPARAAVRARLERYYGDNDGTID